MSKAADVILTIVILVVSAIAAPFMVIISGTVSRDRRDSWNRKANEMSGMKEE